MTEPRIKLANPDRFFAKVQFVDRWYQGTRCLEWQGCTTKGRGGGYGRFSAYSVGRTQK